MSTATVAGPVAVVRHRVRVRGVVQGVGFRPFAFALAQRLALAGHVGNDDAGVFIEVEGDASRVDAFVQALSIEAPPLARVERVTSEAIPLAGDDAFRILPSHARGGAVTPVSPDVAPCGDCLRELADPRDRRYRYPFINCTNCGPRYTIVRDIPYDRAMTTMAAFAMCPNCAQEYHDPLDRRFHAQPVACPACGPRLTWRESPTSASDTGAEGEAALQRALRKLREGAIVAVKGVGGFHLACDATRDAVVARLRARKRRLEKPFALLVADLETARRFAVIGEVEARLLAGPERPIVLVDRRSDADITIAGGVAPGQHTLGVMLPPSPLHLLLSEFGPLVLTSGNLSEEPIARENEEAHHRLGAIADGFLEHDRPIHVVCDDSVVRAHGGGELPLRRSRGYAPYPVPLARPARPVLAVGAELKGTACLTRDRYAFLTPHIGDVGNLETLEAMERACNHFEALFRVIPERIACDLHPGYLSTRWAGERARARGVPLVHVQHHHAHLAALAAEHGLAPDEPLLAFTFDGTGYGRDGTIWGGEVLLGDAHNFTRVAHLATTPLPGGDAAIRHPARVALAQLWAAGEEWRETAPAGAFTPGQLQVLRTQLERGINTVATTSMGRFLDAAASLAGVRHSVSYEGQGAIEFEALARDGAPSSQYRFALSSPNGAPLQFDGAPVLRQIVADQARGRSTRDISRAVHDAIADAILSIAAEMRSIHGIDRVGLTGGVFQNVLLLTLAGERLRRAGFTVLRHHRVPPNDGGLALGQAIVASVFEESS